MGGRGPIAREGGVYWDHAIVQTSYKEFRRSVSRRIGVDCVWEARYCCIMISQLALLGMEFWCAGLGVAVLQCNFTGF